MAVKYLSNCFLTTGKRINNPIIFGNTNARIIASENLITASKVAPAPITTKTKNKIWKLFILEAIRENKNLDELI